ncbi:hypothetical protein QFC22_003209 [Naganishia vaughanmartiniae]|uniref:Uncharacterized protein n=1 Tax=Naganishia vaughanmartiniae TaxID=1424756 RepID=A0ACC2X8W3_9TREE|nr:hypothetical protein QFC22_003209 [Naganishia vaughanmartiniae]
MSAPARPRPRPRPRAKPSGSSDAIPVGEPNPQGHTASKTIITINRETLTASSKIVDASTEGANTESAALEEIADEDFDIFARRRNAVKASRPLTEEHTVPKSDQPGAVSVTESESDYSDGDGHGHRRKRKRNTLNLPAWTQVGYKEKPDRHREDSASSRSYPPGMSKAQRAQMSRSPSAGKRDRQATRSPSHARSRSVSLTPPPQIASIPPIPSLRPAHAIHTFLDDDDDLANSTNNEWTHTSTGVQLGGKPTDDYGMNDDLAALIAKTRAKLAAETANALQHASVTGARAGSSSEVAGYGADRASGDSFVDRGIMLQLTVTMKQDPIRAKVISERALKAYEKPRVFTIGSKCPLDPIYEKLAEVLDKEKEDIILTYNGERIWSSNFTPERLKIYTDEKIEGYEKEAWEVTQAYNQIEQARKLREAELEMAQRHAEVAHSVSAAATAAAHEIEEDDEIAVTSVNIVNPATKGRGLSSSAALGAEGTPALDDGADDDDDADEDTATILALTLRGKEGDARAKAKATTKMSALVAYYVKVKKIVTKMSIELDGEILEGESTVADADLDDGDMLSVVPTK